MDLLFALVIVLCAAFTFVAVRHALTKLVASRRRLREQRIVRVLRGLRDLGGEAMGLELVRAKYAERHHVYLTLNECMERGLVMSRQMPLEPHIGLPRYLYTLRTKGYEAVHRLDRIH